MKTYIKINKKTLYLILILATSIEASSKISGIGGVSSCVKNGIIQLGKKRDRSPVMIDLTDEKKKEVIEMLTSNDKDIQKKWFFTYQPKQNFQIEVTRFHNIPYEQKRQYNETSKWIPILNDIDFYIYSLFLNEQKDNVFVPKLYAALYHLTGEKDESYDSYKGDFSFDFLLNVQKNENKSTYMYKILHYREFLRFFVSRQVPKTDSLRDQVYTNTDEDYFSKQEMLDFSKALIDDLFLKVKEEEYRQKPFVITSYSNFQISGYLKEGYFVKSFTTDEEYSLFLRYAKAYIEGFRLGQRNTVIKVLIRIGFDNETIFEKVVNKFDDTTLEMIQNIREKDAEKDDLSQ